MNSVSRLSYTTHRPIVFALIASSPAQVGSTQIGPLLNVLIRFHSVEKELTFSPIMSLDWTQGNLHEGLRCFNSGAFFEAHEHWESVWLTAQEPEKTFLQGIIQVAASFHHFQRGNCAGTISLLLLGPEPPGCVSRGLWWHCGGAASRGHPFMARSSRNRPAIFPTARSTA